MTGTVQDDREGFCCPRSFAALRMTGKTLRMTGKTLRMTGKTLRMTEGSDGKFEPSGFLFIDQRNDLSDTG